MNSWGREKVPFLFIIDFEMERPVVKRLSDIGGGILFDFRGVTNAASRRDSSPIAMQTQPPPYQEYLAKFDVVLAGLLYGNSFLCNLTMSTPVHLPCTLEDLFHCSNAPYKLWYENQFVFFSPERFVKIENGMISTNPMKGTIDAAVPDAARRLLDDRKEMAEHVTIVDLLRNDLAMVADNVAVKRFRYIDTIHKNNGRLLQVSSEICGHVRDEYAGAYGDILAALLPAGSVSGAPKGSTTRLIQIAEGAKRGYYTGVAGYFDGTTFDSCVMIRFIESTPTGYRYRSGGGITTQSDPRKEYEELISKIYVPVA